MPSPYPGMDPYLEGPLWPDVHGGLASRLREQLVPQLRPKYAVRLAVRVTKERTPESEIEVMFS